MPAVLKPAQEKTAEKTCCEGRLNEVRGEPAPWLRPGSEPQDINFNEVAMIKKFTPLMLPALLLTALAAAAFQPMPAAADTSRHLGRGVAFCGETVPLNRSEVYQSVDQNLLLLSEAKSRVWLTLRRSGRYKPLIEAELKKAGVPADLIYIPMAITSLAPEYNQGGRGIWRFREDDAKALGLRIDKNIDERLDPAASTAAAAKRLSALKATYGYWTTAMAAHLLGDKFISQAIVEAGGEKEFWKLYMPDGLDALPATVIAGKVLFQDPGAFGYHQSSERSWPPMPTQRAEVKENTTARAIAARYKKDYKTFRDANPHLLTGVVPAGVVVNVP